MTPAADEGGLVLGFADPEAELAGSGWRLDASQGGLLLLDGVAHTAELELEEAGEERARARLVAATARCELMLEPRLGSLALARADGSPPPGGGLSAALCSAHLEIDGGPSAGQDCAGYLSGWAVEPGTSPARHLAALDADGSLLLLAGSRPAQASGHGDEDLAAWTVDAEGHVTAFGEAMLSTQYDAHDAVTRAGLELWPPGEPAAPVRASATRLAGSEKEGIAAALMRFAVEGRPALGSYLIHR